jgi:serine/threonine-protein kinase
MSERRVLNYRLKERVGEGACAEVWRAEKNGHDCVLKILKASEASGNAQNFLESLRFEFWVLKDVRHPNIVAVHDFGVTEEGEVFLAEEWLDGTDLKISAATVTSPRASRFCAAFCPDSRLYTNGASCTAI